MAAISARTVMIAFCILVIGFLRPERSDGRPLRNRTECDVKLSDPVSPGKFSGDKIFYFSTVYFPVEEILKVSFANKHHGCRK
jgi:hypothetical protein